MDQQARKSFYRIINFLSEDYLHNDVGDFQLIDRKVINVLKEEKITNHTLGAQLLLLDLSRLGFHIIEMLELKEKVNLV